MRLLHTFVVALIAALAFPAFLQAQEPDIELRQVKLLDDGTAAVQFTVTYRNQNHSPFKFAFFDHPDKVFVQKKGFVTKVHLEQYTGGEIVGDECRSWIPKNYHRPHERGELVFAEIPEGDLLIADYVYRISPKSGYEIILPNGHTTSLKSLVHHLALDLGNAESFEKVMREGHDPCNIDSETDPRLTDEALESLKKRISNLTWRFKLMEEEIRWSFM